MYVIKYPQKGKSSLEGIVLGWGKKAGDMVAKGDLLVEIETPGECIQIESGQEGVLLKALTETGRIARAGDVLAIIGQKGEDVSKVLDRLEQKKSDSVERPSGIQTPARPKNTAGAFSVQSTQSKGEDIKSLQFTGDPNVIPILMPQAGPDMEKGTILCWKVKEGNAIRVGQVIMEIETDTAVMEVESVDAGRIVKIVANAGDVVKVKVPIAYLAES